MQRGSDHVWEDTDIAEHDQDPEEKFEDALVAGTSETHEIVVEEADDSFDHEVSSEGATPVPDNELPHKIRIFYSDAETDPVHQANVELPEHRLVFDSDSNSNDATNMNNVQRNQAADDDLLFHSDNVNETSDFLYACMCISKNLYEWRRQCVCVLLVCVCVHVSINHNEIHAVNVH